MTNEKHALPLNIQRTRVATLVTYYALLAYFAVNVAFIFDDIRIASLIVWAIQTIPLLIFVVGLHRAHLRTYGWLCFVVLLYFSHGVLAAFQPGRLWFGVVEAALSTVLFVLLIIFIRQYKERYKVPL
ncbi:MAG: hypothetical protein COA96_02765 [SAR86 cluster bacterium]|uniref:DUF2069 domain-containing protein n=1 Tax=SAR86 cluster bacterium TaxID=2030880 RepID=A0A2A5B8E1_9GAMM|nr:MAG: hypothetical protein COA96_02765 [SAR86 cluster bacterium]